MPGYGNRTKTGGGAAAPKATKTVSAPAYGHVESFQHMGASVQIIEDGPDYEIIVARGSSKQRFRRLKSYGIDKARDTGRYYAEKAKFPGDARPAF